MTTAPAPAVRRPAEELAGFRARLEGLRAECLEQREAALDETRTSVPDSVALGRATGLLQTIDDIDAALERIAAGTYGSCVHCGSAIPVERLDFRPFAAGCVACSDRGSA